MFGSVYIKDQCIEIFNCCVKGQTYEIENLYANLIVRIEIFFDHLIKLAIKISIIFIIHLDNPVSPQLIKAVFDEYKFMDSFESYSSLAKIDYFRNKYATSTFDFATFNNEIIQTQSETRSLCSSCSVL